MRDNGKVCKGVMNSLITVMAAVAFSPPESQTPLPHPLPADANF